MAEDEAGKVEKPADGADTAAAAEGSTGEAASDPTGEAPSAPADPPQAPIPSADEMRSWRGHKLDDMRGTKTAKVLGVMVDTKSGEPQWLLIRVGLFGHHTLVPARTAVAAGDRVWVPHTREEIRGAPRLDPDESVRAETERGVLEHYGLSGAAERIAELDGRSPSEPSVELKTA